MYEICSKKLVDFTYSLYFCVEELMLFTFVWFAMEQDITSKLISHLYNIDGEWVIQDNETHSQNVAELAQRFAAKFGMDKCGYVAGKLHDLGKARNEFQQYIRSVNGIGLNKTNCEHNHAYVGMVASNQLYPNVSGMVIGSVIESHHRGLYDLDQDGLNERKRKEFPREISMPNADYNAEVYSEICEFSTNSNSFDAQMMIRMLFSCLVDADYTDTEAFMIDKSELLTIQPSGLDVLSNKLLSHIQRVEATCTPCEINDIRHYILEQCTKASNLDRGVYSLSVPTGGGKTISSMVWAIFHALKNGMERVIVAIPFTSIIEQTAQIFRNIFGDEAVLEHHSLMDIDSYTSNSEYNSNEAVRRKIGNWDAPIIVTTNVQLFESLFSHKTSKARKLHNICNSVIILDEAQALPVSLINPIVESLNSLVRKFGCSVLISTATQPALGRQHIGTLPTTRLNGFDKIQEIIPSEAKLFERMNRTVVTNINDSMSYDEIAGEMQRHPKVLCIVNSRKDAYEIYRRLPQNGNSFHLSKNMYPAHIKNAIQDIRDLLSSPNCEELKVVSTQLIEAGVDIDFPVVMRQEAGLDSIIQAAGRCNREGKLESGNVIVFKIKDRPPFPGMIARGNDARKSLSDQSDINNPMVIDEYYSKLYSRCDSFDEISIEGRKDSICKLLTGLPRFQTVGENFKLINDQTQSVIISCTENKTLLNQLRYGQVTKSLLKKLAPYVVSLRDYTLNKLVTTGVIEHWPNDFFVIENPLFYGETGIKLNDEITEEIFIL